MLEPNGLVAQDRGVLVFLKIRCLAYLVWQVCVTLRRFLLGSSGVPDT